MNKRTQIVVRVTEEEKEKLRKFCKDNDESFQRLLRKYIKSLIN